MQSNTDDLDMIVNPIAAQVPRTAGPLSILLVDDDPLVREAMSWMLSDAGHDVHEAEDGIEALDYLLSSHKVDLVITDINMPRMDGLRLAHEAGRRWPGLRVLLVSGRPQPPGTQPYMAKPFRWDALLKAVSGAVLPEGGVTRL